MQRKYLCIAMLVAISAMDAPAASAQACVPPPGFVDTPHPEIAPLEELLSHTEERMIEQPLAAVLDSNSRTPLRIEPSSGLPGVTGTHRLTEGQFQPGTRRLVCLTDGFTVVEQVLVMERTPDTFRFRYVVWNYTSPAFPPISYAVGEFLYTAVGDTRTRKRWTYYFEPDRDRFPGSVGGLGDVWFRRNFLDRKFAPWMRNTIGGNRNSPENG